MNKQFLELVDKLEKIDFVDPKIVSQFKTRLKENPKVYKAEGTSEHFCSFLVPVDFDKRMVFMGHHIKANDWIPPGGHMEPEELPEDTARREFKEELAYSLTTEKILLKNLGITNVKHPLGLCTVHFDFWCIIPIKKQEFVFDRREFYDARWIPFEEAIDKSYRTNIQKIMRSVLLTGRSEV